MEANGCRNSGAMAWMANIIKQYDVRVMELHHTYRELRVYKHWGYDMDGKQEYTRWCACDGVASHVWGLTNIGILGLWLGWQTGLYNMVCM